MRIKVRIKVYTYTYTIVDIRNNWENYKVFTLCTKVKLVRASTIK